MVQKTLQEFSAPSLDNIPTGPRFAVEEGIPEFELKSSLINLVQATQLSGKAHEDASAHLQNFLDIGSTIHINGVDKDVIQLRLFPFSLEGKARKWSYTHQDNINIWTNLSDAFLSKFFPIGKTTAEDKNHSRSMGAFSRIQIRLSSPWNGHIVTYADLLPWINPEGS